MSSVVTDDHASVTSARSDAQGLERRAWFSPATAASSVAVVT
jgi:hypothetical protein